MIHHPSACFPSIVPIFGTLLRRADLEQSLNQTERATVFLRRSVELEAEEWFMHQEDNPLRRQLGTSR